MCRARGECVTHDGSSVWMSNPDTSRRVVFSYVITGYGRNATNWGLPHGYHIRKNPQIYRPFRRLPIRDSPDKMNGKTRNYRNTGGNALFRSDNSPNRRGAATTKKKRTGQESGLTKGGRKKRRPKDREKESKKAKKELLNKIPPAHRYCCVKIAPVASRQVTHMRPSGLNSITRETARWSF